MGAPSPFSVGTALGIATAGELPVRSEIGQQFRLDILVDSWVTADIPPF